MNTPNLDKRLKHHDRMCKMHDFSLREERYCSCGKDSAIVELSVLLAAMEWLVKADEWFSRNDALDTHSLAVGELKEIIERAKHERIISTKSSVRQTRKRTDSD
jgi:hypothetical protein